MTLQNKDSLFPNEIHYKELGDTKSSKTLVFIHGATMTGAGLEPVAMLFSQYHCILIDLPGHGSSLGKPEETVEDIAEIVSTFLDTLREDRRISDDVTLLGYSMGGAVSIENALKKKAYIKRMVIISSGANLADYCPLISETVKHGPDEFNSEEFFQQGFGSGTSPEEKSFLMNALSATKVDDRIGFSDLLSCSRYNKSDRVKELEIPVLIITSDEDQIVLPECGIAFREALQRSSIAVIPFRGHTAVFEMPEYTSEIIHRFLTNY